MARPFSALPSILKKRQKEFFDGVNVLVRDATQKAGQVAVTTTRVDTGKARSNWIAAVGVPSATIIPPYAAGNKLGITETGNAAGAISQHRATLAKWNAAKGIPFFISNNVTYIGELNFGRANLAPGNMLSLAAQTWLIAIKTPRRILK